MLASVKALLNKFSASQPALQTPGAPAASAGVQLGDVIALGDAAAQAAAQAYAATTPANWSGSAPTSVQSALDRIAAALVAAGHTP